VISLEINKTGILLHTMMRLLQRRGKIQRGKADYEIIIGLRVALKRSTTLFNQVSVVAKLLMGGCGKS